MPHFNGVTLHYSRQFCFNFQHFKLEGWLGCSLSYPPQTKKEIPLIIFIHFYYRLIELLLQHEQSKIQVSYIHL